MFSKLRKHQITVLRDVLMKANPRNTYQAYDTRNYQTRVAVLKQGRGVWDGTVAAACSLFLWEQSPKLIP